MLIKHCMFYPRNYWKSIYDIYSTTTYISLISLYTYPVSKLLANCRQVDIKLAQRLVTNTVPSVSALGLCIVDKICLHDMTADCRQKPCKACWHNLRQSDVISCKQILLRFNWWFDHNICYNRFYIKFVVFL